MPTYSSKSEIPLEQIQAQLDQILASNVFSRSHRQSAFLNHVVNAACKNQTDRLKEFTLGVEVFDKDETFDPGTDAIVRVEASRLRAKLREYYLEEGIDDLVKIEIPKGHYVPVFSYVERNEPTPFIAPKAFHLWLGVVAAAFLVGILYLVYETFQEGAIPAASTRQIPWSSRVAVLPLQDLSRPTELHFGEAMTDGLIAALSEAGGLRVTSLASVLRYKNTDVPITSIGIRW